MDLLCFRPYGERLPAWNVKGDDGKLGNPARRATMGGLPPIFLGAKVARTPRARSAGLQRPLMFLRNFLDLLARARSRVLAAPMRWRRWRAKTGPFVFRNDEGARFRLYPPEAVDGHIYVHGYFERQLIDVLRREIAAGRVMLDIGANIGNHAIALHRQFDEIHCFEPNPVVVERLRDNLALSQAGNVSVHAVGLGAEDKVLPFRSNTTGNLGGGSFVSEQFPVSDHLQVVAGDDYLAVTGIGPVDFIKLDVEGFEVEVLRGLERTIARDRPAIVLEYDGRPGANGPRWQDMVAALPGYRFAEPRACSGSGGIADKFLFALRHGGIAKLVPVVAPEPRYYEALIARPLQS